jgi:hypothetical protein
MPSLSRRTPCRVDGRYKTWNDITAHFVEVRSVRFESHSGGCEICFLFWDVTPCLLTFGGTCCLHFHCRRGRREWKKCGHREKESCAVGHEGTSCISLVVLVSKGSLRAPRLAVPCPFSVSHSSTLELLF